MQGNTPQVRSGQPIASPKIGELLRRHSRRRTERPLSDHTVRAFEKIAPLLSQYANSIILDSGCGTGESTRKLAKLHPHSFVIGIDKSDKRLRMLAAEAKLNFLLLRADIFDFWRLCTQHSIRFTHHYLLYPNPWPKSGHLSRRIHAHDGFLDLLSLSHEIELRTNWRIYAEEFANALHHGTDHPCSPSTFLPAEPLTPFERKYLQSGHTLYRCVARLSESR